MDANPGALNLYLINLTALNDVRFCNFSFTGALDLGSFLNPKKIQFWYCVFGKCQMTFGHSLEHVLFDEVTMLKGAKFDFRYSEKLAYMRLIAQPGFDFAMNPTAATIFPENAKSSANRRSIRIFRQSGSGIGAGKGYFRHNFLQSRQ
jgi:hypothetical protein